MNPLLQDFSTIASLPPWLLAVILTWTLAWKGLALWKSAKRNSPAWFVILLVVNTIGILEILYFFLFSEMNFHNKNSKNKMNSRKKSARNKIAKQKAFIDN